MIYFQDDRITLRHGHVLDELRELADNSVHCCVTSPPYFGLRNYNVEGQIGLEPTIEEFVIAIVSVMREVRRVLREDGTCWFNMGDSYNAGRDGGHAGGSRQADLPRHDGISRSGANVPGLKPKDMMLVPARCAIALCTDGWYLRSEIIWHKLVPMPESVKDRPTKAHEMVYLLTKSPQYHYDWEAIATEAKEQSVSRAERGVSDQNKLMDGSPGQSPHSLHQPRGIGEYQSVTKVNARDVWTLGPESFPGAHFATMPTDLARRCLLAGTPKKVCKCGMPYEKVVETSDASHEADSETKYDESQTAGRLAKLRQAARDRGEEYGNRTRVIGYEKTCKCEGEETIRATVLDPFNGAATTGYVARELGFNYVGIDLNRDYLEISKKRLSQNVLF